MTTFFVSRHPGASAWAACQGLAVDRLVAHLDPAEVGAGDTVIGTLPVNLAAAVCGKGAAGLARTGADRSRHGRLRRAA
jgi:CRISPR-associated protein Csx16